MAKFLKASALGLGAACILTLGSSAYAQEDSATPDVAAQTFTYSILQNFSGTSGSTPGTGPYWSAVTQASDGNYYGSAPSGGVNSGLGYGVVYRLSPNGTYSVIQEFYPYQGVDAPTESPIQGTDGLLYGGAGGGNAGAGTIYRMGLDGSNLTALHAFNSSSEGTGPGGLIQGTDGNFYGTLSGGGQHGYGAIFKIAPNGSGFSVLHSFAAGASDGATPNGQLVQGTDGNLYGTTQGGGASSRGVLFSIATDGSNFSVVHSFSTANTDTYTGFGWPIFGTDGNLYGTNVYGSTYGYGGIWKCSTTGSCSLLHAFNSGSADGEYSYAPVFEGSDGNFYGTTNSGGASNRGTAYQVTPAGTFTVLHSFAGGTGDGRNLYATLTQGSDGNFRGTTPTAGLNNDGIIYEEAPTPAMAGPVQLSVTGTVYAGTPFTMTYRTANAGSATLRQCVASNNAGDTSGWTGVITSTPTNNTKSLTAPTSTGTYIYGLECGGIEYGSLSVIVQTAPKDNTSTSLSANPAAISTSGATSVTATVTDTTSSSKTPTGSISFKLGSTSLGGCTLSAGSCSITVQGTALATGSNSITGTYVPSSGFNASSGSTSVTLNADITFSSVTHNFGSVPVGVKSAVYGSYMTNNSQQTITFNVPLTNAAGGFIESSYKTLAPGASTELNFAVTPTAPGSSSTGWSVTGLPGTFTFSPSNGGTLSVTGTNASGLTITTNGHNFGTQAVGTTSATFGAVLTNATGVTVSLSVGSTTSPFHVVLNNCGSSLASGSSCNLQWSFTPTATGTVSENVPLTASQTIYFGSTAVTSMYLAGTGQ